MYWYRRHLLLSIYLEMLASVMGLILYPPIYLENIYLFQPKYIFSLGLIFIQSIYWYHWTIYFWWDSNNTKGVYSTESFRWFVLKWQIHCYWNMNFKNSFKIHCYWIWHFLKYSEIHCYWKYFKLWSFKVFRWF